MPEINQVQLKDRKGKMLRSNNKMIDDDPQGASGLKRGSLSELPQPIMRLTMSPRLKAAARIAEYGAGLEFQLSADIDEFGLPPTLRLISGLLDALETHFEGEDIRLSLTCPSSQVDCLIKNLINVPRLDLRFLPNEQLEDHGLKWASWDLALGEVRALRLLLHAANSERSLVLGLTPNIFPIRPFSARSLGSACLLTSWQDRNSPLSSKRRAAPLRGAALIDRDLAKVAVAKLRSESAALAGLESRARRAAALHIISRAELGFWAPESSNSTPPLLNRLALSEVTWPWPVAPRKSQSEPYFLWFEDLSAHSTSKALQVIYDTLHR